MNRRYSLCILALFFMVTVLVSCNSKEDQPIMNGTAPNVMVDDTLYWITALYEDYTIPEGFVLVGTTTISDGVRAEENFSAYNLAAGSEVYQSQDYPGWIYVCRDKYTFLFTVQELGTSLLKFNDTLYIRADSSLANECDLQEPSPFRFRKSFEYQGNLTFGADGTVPQEEFEVNDMLYQNYQLYYDKTDTSTVCIKKEDSDSPFPSYIVFYDVSLIPIDYSSYIKAQTNREVHE